MNMHNIIKKSIPQNWTLLNHLGMHQPEHVRRYGRQIQFYGFACGLVVLSSSTSGMHYVMIEGKSPWNPYSDRLLNLSIWLVYLDQRQ